MYEEGSQVRRSSKSIVANIVEGYCLRQHKKEFLLYLRRAFGSCEETRSHLRMLYDTGSLKGEELDRKIIDQYHLLGKMLFRLIAAVSVRHRSSGYAEDSNIIPGA